MTTEIGQKLTTEDQEAVIASVTRYWCDQIEDHEYPDNVLRDLIELKTGRRAPRVEGDGDPLGGDMMTFRELFDMWRRDHPAGLVDLLKESFEVTS